MVSPARGYGHDLRAMANAVSARTRLIFIANPNNPTGTWADEEALVGLLEAVPPEVLVVVDEANCEYVDTPGYPDGVAWLARFPNLVVTRTFSKIHGLAGLRVGYAVSDPGVAELLNRVREPFNVNAVGLAAAAAALADEAHIVSSLALNRAGLRQLQAACDRLELDYIPSVGNFLCIELDRPARGVYETLLHEGVIVRPVGNYGLPNHLRVSVGTAAENEHFIGALEGALGWAGRAACER
jgi:histidinol-phosphate aminotransferase